MKSFLILIGLLIGFNLGSNLVKYSFSYSKYKAAKLEAFRIKNETFLFGGPLVKRPSFINYKEPKLASNQA